MYWYLINPTLLLIFFCFLGVFIFGGHTYDSSGHPSILISAVSPHRVTGFYFRKKVIDKPYLMVSKDQKIVLRRHNFQKMYFILSRVISHVTYE